MTLTQLCEHTPNHATLMITGEANTKFGKENFLSNIAGKYTQYNETNNNGKRLSNLVEEMNMYIMSSKFKHKRRHKETWIIPAKIYGNQIDHILTTKKREIIHDVRTYRIANAYIGHQLVILETALSATIKKRDINLRKK